MTFEGLVPDDFEEFRSVKFWDGFFQKRKQKAFEWYGEWRQLQPLVWGACARPNKQILMLGCGNSDLSAQMYDAGCRAITNIDFSKVCIKEMLMKNLRQRPQMKWLVMDMTQLTFKAGSFHIAFDKGALDALMGEDTDAASTAGGKLLSEVQKVLDPSEGQYLCVTLGQPHVLEKLLSSFGNGWSISIDRVPPSADMAASPLQPLLVIVTRCSQQPQHTQETDGQVDDLDYIDIEDGSDVGAGQHGTSPEPAPAVQLSFKAEAGAVNDEQLADIIKIVRQENLLRASGGRSHNPQSKPASQPAPIGAAAREPASPFDHLAPGRRLQLSLPQSAAGPPEVRGDLNGGENEEESASFTAAVLDVDEGKAKQAVRDCAVFIVPQGREHEWLFASPEGQAQVAQGCSAKRVIVVSLNRGHLFGSLKAVQAELSPLVVDLAPIASRQLEGAIPFMTTQEGIGSRNVLEEAESALTGHISVEDVTLRNDDSADITLRRMVFTNNRNLIQSEAILCPAGNTAQLSSEPTASAAASGQQANAAANTSLGKKGKGKAKATKHKAKSAAEGQSSPSNKGQQPLVVDHSQLACEYHKGIVTGLSLIQPNLSTISQTYRLAAPTHPASSSGAQQEVHGDSQHESQQQQQQPEVNSQGAEQSQKSQHSCREAQGSAKGRGKPQALVVGLGGGALPVFLNRHCHMDVQSVELDPVVVDLARGHFSFADSATLRATVGDGLDVVAQFAQRLNTSSAEADDARQAAEPVAHDSQSLTQGPVSPDTWHSQHLDLLVVDAGSGDASVPMSCPPAAFLESRFLGHARQVLKPGGMLAVNCVSRAAEPYKAAVKSLQAVFAEVYELDVDEDINKVLFALPKPFQSTGKSTHTANASMHGSKKSKGGRGSLSAKPACLDGSAAGVKLLMPRLLGAIANLTQKQQSELENMLSTLTLCK